MMNRVQSYYGSINFMLLLITTYTIREATLKHYIPGITFWWLLGAGAVLIIAVAVIDYKLVHPSEIIYAHSQSWKHNNPVRKQLTRMEESANRLQRRDTEELKALMGAIDSLRQSVDRLESTLHRDGGDK